MYKVRYNQEARCFFITNDQEYLGRFYRPQDVVEFMRKNEVKLWAVSEQAMTKLKQLQFKIE